MSNDVPFIQQLLIAEKNAKEVVDAARKRRMKRIQQAKAEAKEEIARIDKELGEKFKEYEAETAQSSIQVSHKIKQETIHFLRQMIKEAARHKEAIMSDLIDLCVDVQLQFHRNYKLPSLYDDEEYDPPELSM